jgi:hypothetical protein
MAIIVNEMEIKVLPPETQPATPPPSPASKPMLSGNGQKNHRLSRDRHTRLETH